MARRYEVEVEIELIRGDDLYAVLVTCDYSPERPPPPCSDHDSPLFDDCGDAAECAVKQVEIEEAFNDDGEELPPDRRLSADALLRSLTRAEQEIIKVAAEHATPSDGPDPDEAYDMWRERSDPTAR